MGNISLKLTGVCIKICDDFSIQKLKHFFFFLVTIQLGYFLQLLDKISPQLSESLHQKYCIIQWYHDSYPLPFGYQDTPDHIQVNRVGERDLLQILVCDWVPQSMSILIFAIRICNESPLPPCKFQAQIREVWALHVAIWLLSLAREFSHESWQHQQPSLNCLLPHCACTQ